MNALARAAGAAALISLGSGCVEKTRYDALQAKYKESDAAIQARDAEIVELKRQVALSAAERGEVDKEVVLLRAHIEAKEVEASLKTAQPDPEHPVALVASHAEGDAVAPIGDGWTTNPATGGIVLDAGVLFLPGGGQLRAQASQVLDRLVTELGRPEAKDLLVRIEGHTDDTPINKSRNRDNWELAGKRALAVLNYLEEHGVSPERLSFAGYGSQRPLSGGAEKDARAQNRRVEVLLFRRK